MKPILATDADGSHFGMLDAIKAEGIEILRETARRLVCETPLLDVVDKARGYESDSFVTQCDDRMGGNSWQI